MLIGHHNDATECAGYAIWTTRKAKPPGLIARYYVRNWRKRVCLRKRLNSDDAIEMASNQTQPAALSDSLLATILSDETFRPNEPALLSDTGLPASLIEDLVVKRLSVVGLSSGRQLANDLCLPFHVLEDTYQLLRSRQIIVHKGSAPLNDYNYSLTDNGRDRARIALQVCSYSGAAPVPLMDYVLSAEAQTIRAESPKAQQLRKAFADISVDEALFESLGPAINSGAGLFLYGEPGNGKSTLAQRITQCFGHEIWIPHCIYEDGQFIKFFDAAYHQISNDEHENLVSLQSFDRRWVKIRRPTVIVGGELTIDALEIRHDPNSNTCEASLQMKSNCGCLLIDDFGRQRIEPQELLNRWIVPLESRVDFLALPSGKKIQVPFEQLIIFSTNLEPAQLVDEAFLRRIPYKIEIADPSPQEFHALFEIYCRNFECEYIPEIVNYLLEKHYLSMGRRLRRCHPRDLLSQIRNFCVYNDLPMEIRPEYFDRVVKSYFTVVLDAKPKTMAKGVGPDPVPAVSVPAEQVHATVSPSPPPTVTQVVEQPVTVTQVVEQPVTVTQVVEQPVTVTQVLPQETRHTDSITSNPAVRPNPVTAVLPNSLTEAARTVNLRTVDPIAADPAAVNQAGINLGMPDSAVTPSAISPGAENTGAAMPIVQPIPVIRPDTTPGDVGPSATPNV